MVKAGAFVSGPKPIMDPSMSDDPDEFNTIVKELWTKEKGENILGKGKVYIGYTIPETLAAMNIGEDFSYTKPQEDTRMFYVHRRAGDIDIYWVNNRNNRTENLEATFRVEGKEAEIWHPETGKVEQASYKIENGVTSVPLHLEPNDALFLVFRNKAREAVRTITSRQEIELATVRRTLDGEISGKERRPC